MKVEPLTIIKIKLRAYLSSFKQVKNAGKFVIYGQGRTGSTLLTDLLNSHPQIACTNELFHRWRSLFEGKAWFPYRYLRGMEVQASPYIFFFFFKIYQLIRVQKIDPEDFLNRLEARGYQIIYLRRNNFLEHALSGIIRRRRNSSSFFKKGYTYQENPFEVSIEVLKKELNYRADNQELELKYLEGRKYLEVIYERDLKDSKEHQKISNTLFNYLGLESVKVETKLQKINKKRSKDVLSNYDELSAYFKNTPFGKFFL
ncbi:MAG: sulfotransferase [Saprospiraceae bacterium]